MFSYAQYTPQDWCGRNLPVILSGLIAVAISTTAYQKAEKIRLLLDKFLSVALKKPPICHPPKQEDEGSNGPDEDDDDEEEDDEEDEGSDDQMQKSRRKKGKKKDKLDLLEAMST